jgi:hypothetical protein
MMEQAIEVVIVLAACRFLIHAFSKLVQIGVGFWEAQARGASMPAVSQVLRAEAYRSLIRLLVAGVLPPVAFVQFGYRLVGEGWTGSVWTGLACAAVIAGLHNLGNIFNIPKGED